MDHTRSAVLTALFTALIAMSSLISLPIGPVPVVLTTLFVVLSGMLGGVSIGLGAVGIYLLAGALGLPVFAGASGGMAKLLGPTGGFLAGYLLAALCGGLLYRNSEKGILYAAGISFLAGALIYLPGIPWLKYSLSMTWGAAFKAGLLPFLPGYILKSLGAAILARNFKRRFTAFLTKGEV